MSLIPCRAEDPGPRLLQFSKQSRDMFDMVVQCKIATYNARGYVPSNPSTNPIGLTMKPDYVQVEAETASGHPLPHSPLPHSHLHLHFHPRHRHRPRLPCPP